jgi:hypothetical protein
MTQQRPAQGQMFCLRAPTTAQRRHQHMQERLGIILAHRFCGDTVQLRILRRQQLRHPAKLGLFDELT